MAVGIKRTLPSGVEIEIREMSVDDIDECKDFITVSFEDGKPQSITNVNKSRTLWLRKGLSAVGEWKSKNGACPPDEFLKTMDEDDRQKALNLIQDAQVVTKKKPSSPPSMSS